LDSYVRPPGSRKNVNTELFQGVAHRHKVDLRQAYELGRGVVRAQPDPRIGHRLVWARGTSFASMHLGAHDINATGVVGRHTQCGIQLPDDPFVALRHLLVRSIALPTGGVALRVFDLQTNIGFTLPDGSSHTSIFAEGPVAIGVGEYALVALPCDGKDDQLPPELPPPAVHSPKEVRAQLDVLEQAMSPYRQNARPPLYTSKITLMPNLLMVGDALPPSIGRLAGGRHRITLARGDRAATMMVSDEDVSRGILIGRSEKCVAEELRRITDVNTSRVHVLIVREGTAIVAYDLASTHGTYTAAGEIVRRTVLVDTSRGGGNTLYLGRGPSAVVLTWHS
jgi:hypothetical protein